MLDIFVFSDMYIILYDRHVGGAQNQEMYGKMHRKNGISLNILVGFGDQTCFGKLVTPGIIYN